MIRQVLMVCLLAVLLPCSAQADMEDWCYFYTGGSGCDLSNLDPCPAGCNAAGSNCDPPNYSAVEEGADSDSTYSHVADALYEAITTGEDVSGYEFNDAVGFQSHDCTDEGYCYCDVDENGNEKCIFEVSHTNTELEIPLETGLPCTIDGDDPFGYGS